jgi:EpsI family protein
MPERRQWIPAAILGVGCLLNVSVNAQRSMPLADSLESLPKAVLGYDGQTLKLDSAQLKLAGPTAALSRFYRRDSADFFSLYVGYYERQKQGSTIHSPKNCLPGAGWEPIGSRRLAVDTDQGPVLLNRFVIAKKAERALVYYWYQGRGRTEADEYKVKLDLIRDAALYRRSDEALVRLVLPLSGGEAAADSTAHRLVRALSPELRRVFPAEI